MTAVIDCDGIGRIYPSSKKDTVEPARVVKLCCGLSGMERKVSRSKVVFNRANLTTELG